MSFRSALERADRRIRDSLGDVVTYASSAGQTVVVNGIFDRAYQRVDPKRAGVMSSAPAVWLVLADLPSDPSTDDATFTIDGVVFHSVEQKKDGMGSVLCVLHVGTPDEA